MTTPQVTAADFKKIQWHLLFLCIALGLGSAAVYGARQFEQKVKVAHLKVKNERNDVRGKLARAQDEEKELRAKIVRHQQMTSMGIIGQEHRLDWVERIHQIKQERKLIDLQYELAPQKQVDAAIVPADGPGFEVMASPMKLQLQLLHENDLLNFFDDVRSNTQAYVRPRQCSLQRLPPQAKEQPNSALLKADCYLDWITLREKS